MKSSVNQAIARRIWLGGLLLMALCAEVQPVHADDYYFVGGLALLPKYGGHPTIPDYLPPDAGDVYTENLSGSFDDPTAWGVDEYPYISSGPTFAYSPSAPGPGDTVSISGEAAGYFTPTEGPADDSVPDDPVYGYYAIDGYEFGGYVSDSFNVSGVGGTIAILEVGGPGTLTLTNLNATTSATFSSEGGLPVLGLTSSEAGAFYGFSNSVQVITGGSLSTPLLTLSAGTNLAPFYGYGATGQVADPVADAGSLTINGANLSGTVTQIGDLPAGTTSTEAYNVQPVTLTNGATLNASTELDIIGIDPTAYPLVTGTTTLSLNASTITAGLVVIATGAGGYGTGNPDAPAELDLTNGSTMTITNGSLIVGDTGDGTLMVSGGSTITDQQGIIGNATDSTGTVTIDGSTWTNNGYLSVGNNGIGTLTIQNGAQVTTTGSYGNIYIAGLTGSSDSSITVTGSGSLLQSSGYLSIAQDGTGDGDATLTVEDQAQVITGDVMYVGEVQGATGTVDISDGATVTNNTTGTYGPNSTILGVVAGSYGYLYIDGSGSKLESTGDMSIGYDGSGTATITDGGSLIVDGTLFRVGRDEGSTGTLTVTGTGSSVTANSGTIYIGYGGSGTVEIEDGANMTVMATNIGGESGGTGELDIDGEGTTADLGDVEVGDGGTGTLDVSGGASVTLDDLTVGDVAQDDGTVTLTGSDTQITVSDDLTIGNMATGTVELDGDEDGGPTLMVDGSLTVGSGSGGKGTLSIYAGSVTTSGDMTLGDESGATGTVTVGDAPAQLTVGGDLTVADGGKGTLLVNPGSTLTIQGGTFTIGGQAMSNGLVTMNGATLSFGGTLTIGDGGKGELDLQEGTTNAGGGTGLSTPSVILGNQTGASGTLSLDGAGTDFQVSELTVGESGKGTLSLADSAVLTVNGEATIGDQLSGAVSGATVATSSMFAVNGDLTVGSGSIATLDITTGGMTTAIGDVDIGENPNGDGTVTVTGVAATGGLSSSLGYGQTLTVGDYGTGVLDVTAGGYVAPTPNGTGDVDIAAQTNSTGNVTVSGSDTTSGVSSELDATNLAVGGTMKAAGGTGNLTVGADGVVKVKTKLQTWAKGTVDVSGGGSVTVGSGGAAAAGSVQIDTGGTLGGGGTIDGNVVNAGGVVAPGDPQTLTINGNYTQTGGVLDFEIGGTGAGQFDSIVATGNISLTNATIDLDFINGFAPTQGETFDFLSSSGGNSISGLTFDITGLDPGFQFDTTSNSTTDSFVLTALNNGVATPEPSTWAMMIFSGLGVLAWRRFGQAKLRVF